MITFCSYVTDLRSVTYGPKEAAMVHRKSRMNRWNYAKMSSLWLWNRA